MSYRHAVRTIVCLLGCLLVVSAAAAPFKLDVAVLPKPGFPAPATEVTSTGPRLEVVSSSYRSPIAPTQPPAERPSWAPRTFRGADLQRTIRQGANLFLVYGRDGSSGRFLVGTRAGALRYAFDFVKFANPPNGGWFEEITWARESDGVLYVENTHLTYASATRNRNAYISAIDLGTRKTLWRSRALVANARTFVLAGNLIVAGYGFTREPDFLYLLDRKTGRALDRIGVPSAPERIVLRDGRLHVRTYDRQVIARIAAS